MALGDKIVEITFVSVPAINETLHVNLKVIGGGVSLRGETFKAARTTSGQVERTANLEKLATNYADAFYLDYCLTGNLTVSVVGVVVRISIPANSTYDYIDDIWLSSAFATYVLFPWASNNVIHQIWFTPIFRTPSTFVATNFLVTTNNLKLTTLSGLNIITNG